MSKPKKTQTYPDLKEGVYFAFAKGAKHKNLSVEDKSELQAPLNKQASSNLNKLKNKLTLPPKKEAKQKEKILQLEQSLVQYQNTPTEDLLQKSLPLPGDEEKKSYKLSPEQAQARLVYLHRELSRGTQVEVIAEKLKISVALVYVLRRDLEARLRDSLLYLDIPQAIGDSLHFYEDVRSVALSYTQDTLPYHPKIKLEALKVALEAERDKNTFLKNLGVYGKQLEEFLIAKLITPNSQLIDITPEDDTAPIINQLVTTLRSYTSSRPPTPSPSHPSKNTEISSEPPQNTPQSPDSTGPEPQDIAISDTDGEESIDVGHS